MRPPILSLLVAIGLIGSASAATLSYTNFIDNSFSSGFDFSYTVVPPYVGSMVLSFDSETALSDGSYAWDSLSNLNFSATFDGYGTLTQNDLLDSSYYQLGRTSSSLYIQLVGSSFLFTSSNDGNSGVTYRGITHMEGATSFGNGNLYFSPLLLNKDDLTGNAGQYQADVTSLYVFSANAASWTLMGNYGKPANGVYAYPSPSPTPPPSGGGGGAVPEPSTYALFGLGAIGMLMVLRRKKTA